MFKFLRSQAKVFYWVIAGSFILFLFLGGMTGRGCQAPGTSNIEPGVIGSVNGDNITSEQYDASIRQQTAQMRQQNNNQSLNENQYAAASDRAWDALVRNLLVEQAVAEANIKISDEEVLAIFQNSPPPELLAQFRNEDGSVNMEAYYSALQNPENDWTSAEAYIRSLIPRQKLNDEIAGGAFVTDISVREEYIRQTGRAVAEYMGVLFTEVGTDYEPSESEITAWFNSHAEDYQKEAQAQVKVVRFAKTPSDADYQDVLIEIRAIRDEIVSGDKDFAFAVGEYSEDTGTKLRGGDLGRFDRNRMVPEFTEVAFSLPVGELSEPLKTQFGYHLIEVTEREIDETTGEVYEVSARHILLKVTPGIDTLDLARDAAEDFRTRVNSGNFLTTAEAEAMDLVAPAAFPAGRDIPSVSLSLRGSNWAFDASPGEISPVYSNQNVFYVVLAEEGIPAGTQSLETARGQVTLAVRKDHNMALAKTKLAPAVGEVQMGSNMADVAQAHGLTHAVTDTFTANGNVQGVGYGTDFNMVTIQGTLGQLIPEVETLRGVFASVPMWVKPIDQADFDQRQAAIHSILLQRAQGEIINAWFDEQMANAEIVDHRHRLRQGT